MSQQGTARSYADAHTRTIAAAGATFACRELGPQSGVPLVLLTHLGANLDGWDPRIVDGLAQDQRHRGRLPRRRPIPQDASASRSRRWPTTSWP